MYEIWLGLNIVYELALGYIVHIALYLLLLAAFYFSVWRQQLSLRGAVRPTLLFAAVAAVLAMLLVPASTRSSLNEVNYLVDWMNLLGISLGVAGLLALLVWPLYALYCPSCRQGVCKR